MTSSPAPLPARGPLTEFELPGLLLELYQQRFNGRLCLARGRTQKAFVFQAGAPIASESNVPAERLTGVLEHAGELTRAQRDEVDRYVAREQCQEGVALLKLELIEPRALFLGLREQLRHRVLETFSWVDGDFALDPSDERSEDVQPFRADPYQLVQEGLRSHWSVERLLAGLEPRMELYPRPGSGLAEAVRRIALDATVERLIAGLNGRQKLGVLVCGAASSPSAVAAFWVLDAIGALAYSETQADDSNEDDAGPVEIDIAIRGDAGTREDHPGIAENPGASASNRATPELPSENPEAEKMRAEIAEMLESLDERNYYEQLGVPADAPLAAIRKAYFRAAKRFHPDAIARLGLEDMRAEAGEIFSRIALANETLCDASRRQEYDRALAGGAEQIDVTTLAQAETFYRKGEILIRMGDFRGALEYLKNAVELYPDEAVYQSDLGWAYYKKEPPEPEQARKHLARALELDPGNNVAEFRAGILAR